MRTKRDLQFDIVRVIATLWIVGVWHVLDYIDSPHLLAMKGKLGYITTCMLATFMFISGYFLSKYTFDTKGSIITFYKKRLTRFFPLFLLSALLLYRLGFNPDYRQFIFTVTGISSYFGYQSGTIWFISMLFSFYMATPLITKGLDIIKYNIVVKSIVVVVVSAVFIYILSCTSLNYDIRLSYTMPFYGLGLIFGRESFVKEYTSKWYVLLLSAIFLMLLYYFHFVGVQYLHINTVVGLVLFLCLCYWIKYLPINRLVSILSYASMAMYLFHRPVYHLGIKYILHDNKATIAEMIFILLPIVIITSYIIQSFYDFCVDKLEHRK